MKKHYVLLIIFYIILGFQNLFSSTDHPGGPVLDPYNPEYEEGVVLVKFKDDVSVSLGTTNNKTSTGLPAFDVLLESFGASQVTKVFNAEKRHEKLFIQIPGVGEKEVPQLFNIFKFTFDSETDAKEIAELLSADDHVEYAEPNYIFALAYMHLNQQFTAENISSGLSFNETALENPVDENNKSGDKFSPNDPF
jgi:hypothetical protein